MIQADHAEYRALRPADLPGVRTILDGRGVLDAGDWPGSRLVQIGRAGTIVKVVSIVGARPQFVKLAPIAEAFDAAGIDHVIVHTGQHYDANMSDVFFADLAIPAPDINLEIGSGATASRPGPCSPRSTPVLADLSPDWVLVYGDTNSTLAGALSAVKQHLPVAHLEAGLRSFNRRMPEEHNRVLTDHAADLLLAPTQTAMDHLAARASGRDRSSSATSWPTSASAWQRSVGTNRFRSPSSASNPAATWPPPSTALRTPTTQPGLASIIARLRDLPTTRRAHGAPATASPRRRRRDRSRQGARCAPSTRSPTRR